MTIHLPGELESGIQAAVLTGRFASVDDAMAQAVRLLLRDLEQKQSPAEASGKNSDPILGLMRDDVELMDEIVADAYRHRREEQWRDISVE